MRIESNHGEQHSLHHLIHGLHPMISLLQEQDIKYLPILKQAGIPTEALSQPEYAITPSQEIGFTTAIYQHLDLPELGLLMGPRYHLSSYGMLGLAAMTSSNLAECFKVMMENIILTWTYFKTTMYTEKELGYIEMEPTRDLGECMQYMIDRDLSAACMIAHDALECELELTRVEFSRPATSYPQKYEEVFKCPVAFNAQHNRICFDKHWLDKPLPKAQPDTSRIFVAQCQEIARSLRKKYSFAEHVRYHLLNTGSETPSLDSVASALNTTPRTVQRKLAAEDIRFQELLDDVRVSISSEFLVTTRLPIEEIAFRVGYGDAAAFSNAFKRWKGVSPKHYRNSW